MFLHLEGIVQGDPLHVAKLRLFMHELGNEI